MQTELDFLFWPPQQETHWTNWIVNLVYMYIIYVILSYMDDNNRKGLKILPDGWTIALLFCYLGLKLNFYLNDRDQEKEFKQQVKKVKKEDPFKINNMFLMK